jgi:hypothetical protein
VEQSHRLRVATGETVEISAADQGHEQVTPSFLNRNDGVLPCPIRQVQRHPSSLENQSAHLRKNLHFDDFLVRVAPIAAAAAAAVVGQNGRRLKRRWRHLSVHCPHAPFNQIKFNQTIRLLL